MVIWPLRGKEMNAMDWEEVSSFSLELARREQAEDDEGDTSPKSVI
jgi:hypothetical protein